MFYGREYLMDQLEPLCDKRVPSSATCRGRHRIGKCAAVAVSFLMVAGGAAMGASEGYALATYSYENDGKTFVATVSEGNVATLADGDEAAATLNANGVTNFVKRGDGTLKVSANLSSFTGDLYVEDGVYSSSPTTANAANTTAGATGTDYKIFVRDGATFDINTSVVGHSLSREWHFSGRGHDDATLGELGALHTTASGQALNAVTGKVILEGDTLMRYTSGGNVAFVGCPMDMQNHDLKLKSDAQTLGPVIQCNNLGESFRANAGNVLIEGCANISGYLSWLYCSPTGDKSLIVNTNATLILNSMDSLENRSTAYHALVLRKGAKINLYGGYDKVFAGPVTFEDPDRNVITSTSSDGRYQINFRGGIYGSGFSVQGKVKVEMLKTNSSKFPNDSTNGMVVAGGAFIDLRSNTGALLNVTETGGDIVVSNGTVCSGNSYYSFEKLNAITFAGNCTWAGYPFFNYDSPWSSSVAPGSSRTAVKFTNLYFTGNPTVAFSTNVVTVTLHGLGSVSNEVDVAGAGSNSYGGGTATKCDNFKIRTAWTFDVDDVLAGGCLAASGRIDFDSGATIRMEGTSKPTDGNFSRVVAYAEGGINGLASATLEVSAGSRWRLVAGADGKTLVAVYVPRGLLLTVH